MVSRDGNGCYNQIIAHGFCHFPLRGRTLFHASAQSPSHRNSLPLIASVWILPIGCSSSLTAATWFSLMGCSLSVLQCRSPMESQVLSANLLQCGLHFFCQATGLARSLLQRGHGLPLQATTSAEVSCLSSCICVEATHFSGTVSGVTGLGSEASAHH